VCGCYFGEKKRIKIENVNKNKRGMKKGKLNFNWQKNYRYALYLKGKKA
jgi:hypothetical protein